MVVRPDGVVPPERAVQNGDTPRGVRIISDESSSQDNTPPRSAPHSPASDIQLTETSLSREHVTIGESPVPFREVSQQRFDAMVAQALAVLSPKAQLCCQLPELLRQRTVYNSAMVYTEPFDHLVVSRFGHQVHAAAQVAELREVQRRNPQQINMTSYELEVLEIALLFHDFGHVVGSHAMDQVFAAMRSKPEHIEKFYKEDFHEYHGAQEFGKRREPDSIREVLGRPLFDDVLAVLSYYDKRDLEEKNRDYGLFSPSLAEDRLNAIHSLCDLLDRSSYLVLDYCTSGYSEDEVQETLGVVKNFLQKLHVVNGGSVVNDFESTQRVIGVRKSHFERVPGHPTNGLVGAFLQTEAWKIFEHTGASLSPQLYDWVREASFRDPKEVLGKEAWSKLTNKRLTHTIAPVCTLSKADFQPERTTGKLGYLKPVHEDQSFPEGLVKATRGVPLYQASVFELKIGEALRRNNIDIPVYVLVCPALDKPFKHTVWIDGEARTVTRSPDPETEYSGYVVVAAQAIDDHGNPHDLSRVQEIVERVICQNGWLKPGVVIRDKYNPRVFVEPLKEVMFRQEIIDKMDDLHPEWIRKGGSGLITESGLRTTVANDDSPAEEDPEFPIHWQ